MGQKGGRHRHIGRGASLTGAMAAAGAPGAAGGGAAGGRVREFVAVRGGGGGAWPPGAAPPAPAGGARGEGGRGGEPAERELEAARVEWARRAGEQREALRALSGALAPVLERAAGCAGELRASLEAGRVLERECAALRAENAALVGRCEAAEARHAALQRDFQVVILESVRLARASAVGEAGESAARTPAVPEPRAPVSSSMGGTSPSCAGVSQKRFLETLREFQAASSETSSEGGLLESSEAASCAAGECPPRSPEDPAEAPESSVALEEAPPSEDRGSSFFGIPWGDLQRHLGALRAGGVLPHLDDSEEEEDGAGAGEGKDGLAERGAEGQRACSAQEMASACSSSAPDRWAPALGRGGRELLARYRHALVEVQRAHEPGEAWGKRSGPRLAGGRRAAAGGQKENRRDLVSHVPASSQQPWKPAGRAAPQAAVAAVAAAAPR